MNTTSGITVNDAGIETHHPMTLTTEPVTGPDALLGAGEQGRGLTGN